MQIVAFYLHNILQPLGAYAPLGLFITEQLLPIMQPPPTLAALLLKWKGPPFYFL